MQCHSFSFPLVSLERTIEDHESVIEVLSGCGMDTDSRLYFRKNYAKYEFFRKPLVSLWWKSTLFMVLCSYPSLCILYMHSLYWVCINLCCFYIGRTFSRITWFPYQVKPVGWWITLSLYRYYVLFVYSALSLPLSAYHKSLLCLNVLCYLENLLHTPIYGQIFIYPTQTFLNSSTCPEIHGHLHAKEQSRKSWKKFYFVLRRSGLYFSNKGTSKVSQTNLKSNIKSRLIHGLFVAYSQNHSVASIPIFTCNCITLVSLKLNKSFIYLWR